MTGGTPAQGSQRVVLFCSDGRSSRVVYHALAREGWDVNRQGLHGAPPVRVVASEERHATVLDSMYAD